MSKGEESLRPILMADDDLDDCMLAERALKKGRVSNPVIKVHDGEELMDYLYQRGAYASPDSAPRPLLILLDLNMPRKNGYEALTEIKSDPRLQSIPVVVLTTSKQEEDIYAAYELSVSGYIVKPVNMDGLIEAMTMLGHYWFKLVELPER